MSELKTCECGEPTYRVYCSMCESDVGLFTTPAQPSKPLTTEQWGAIALGVGCDADRDDPVLVGKLVRAIEAHHGIKEQP